MSWLELSVRVTREHAPLVETLLQNEPVLALTLTDDADDPVLEPGVGETPLWPSICVTALFSSDAPVESLSRLLSLIPGVNRPQQVNIRKLEDQPWERVWLDRFKPMNFGANLWIVPGEQEAPSDALHVLRLDPGLAFGTGTHPTTRLCLRWIDGHSFQGLTVVDYGCGSGVLGIAAAIKGADKVICIDNDPQARIATRDNAERNRVTEKIQVLSPDQFSPAHTDIVLANILAGPLIELAPVLLASLRRGGFLVLSGILETQIGALQKTYQPQLDNMNTTLDDGWACLHGQKSSPETSR